MTGEIFKRRLDSLARIINGDAICSAVVIYDGKLIVSNNTYQNHPLIKDLFGFLKKIVTNNLSRNDLRSGQYLNQYEALKNKITDFAQKAAENGPLAKALKGKLNKLKKIEELGLNHVDNQKNLQSLTDEFTKLKTKLITSINLTGAQVLQKLGSPEGIAELVSRYQGVYDKALENPTVKQKLSKDLRKLMGSLVVDSKKPFSPDIKDAFKKDYTFLSKNKEKKLHAEMQILDHIIDPETGKITNANGKVYIGITKLACKNCEAAINAYNRYDIDTNGNDVGPHKVIVEVRGGHNQEDRSKSWKAPTFLSLIEQEYQALLDKNNNDVRGHSPSDSESEPEMDICIKTRRPTRSSDKSLLCNINKRKETLNDMDQRIYNTHAFGDLGKLNVAITQIVVDRLSLSSTQNISVTSLSIKKKKIHIQYHMDTVGRGTLIISEQEVKSYMNAEPKSGAHRMAGVTKAVGFLSTIYGWKSVNENFSNKPTYKNVMDVAQLSYASVMLVGGRQINKFNDKVCTQVASHLGKKIVKSIDHIPNTFLSPTSKVVLKTSSQFTMKLAKRTMGSIPYIGIGFDIYNIKEAIDEKDYIDAALQILSTVIQFIPGPGTILSFLIDIISISRKFGPQSEYMMAAGCTPFCSALLHKKSEVMTSPTVSNIDGKAKVYTIVYDSMHCTKGDKLILDNTGDDLQVYDHSNNIIFHNTHKNEFLSFYLHNEKPFLFIKPSNGNFTIILQGNLPKTTSVFEKYICMRNDQEYGLLCAYASNEITLIHHNKSLSLIVTAKLLNSNVVNHYIQWQGVITCNFTTQGAYNYIQSKNIRSTGSDLIFAQYQLKTILLTSANNPNITAYISPVQNNAEKMIINTILTIKNAETIQINSQEAEIINTIVIDSNMGQTEFKFVQQRLELVKLSDEKILASFEFNGQTSVQYTVHQGNFICHLDVEKYKSYNGYFSGLCFTQPTLLPNEEFNFADYPRIDYVVASKNGGVYRNSLVKGKIFKTLPEQEDPVQFIGGKVDDLFHMDSQINILHNTVKDSAGNNKIYIDSNSKFTAIQHNPHGTGVFNVYIQDETKNIKAVFVNNDLYIYSQNIHESVLTVNFGLRNKFTAVRHKLDGQDDYFIVRVKNFKNIAEYYTFNNNENEVLSIKCDMNKSPSTIVVCAVHSYRIIDNTTEYNMKVNGYTTVYNRKPDAFITANDGNNSLASPENIPTNFVINLLGCGLNEVIMYKNDRLVFQLPTLADLLLVRYSGEEKNDLYIRFNNADCESVTVIHNYFIIPNLNVEIYDNAHKSYSFTEMFKIHAKSLSYKAGSIHLLEEFVDYKLPVYNPYLSEAIPSDKYIIDDSYIASGKTMDQKSLTPYLTNATGIICGHVLHCEVYYFGPNSLTLFHIDKKGTIKTGDADDVVVIANYENNTEIDLGGGINTASFAYSPYWVSIDLSQEVALTKNLKNKLDLQGVINVIGSAYNDIIIGDAVNNQISGGLGVDYLSGMGGNDTFIFDKSSIIYGHHTMDYIKDFCLLRNNSDADIIDLHHLTEGNREKVSFGYTDDNIYLLVNDTNYSHTIYLTNINRFNAVFQEDFIDVLIRQEQLLI